MFSRHKSSFIWIFSQVSWENLVVQGSNYSFSTSSQYMNDFCLNFEVFWNMLFVFIPFIG